MRPVSRQQNTKSRGNATTKLQIWPKHKLQALRLLQELIQSYSQSDAGGTEVLKKHWRSFCMASSMACDIGSFRRCGGPSRRRRMVLNLMGGWKCLSHMEPEIFGLAVMDTAAINGTRPIWHLMCTIRDHGLDTVLMWIWPTICHQQYLRCTINRASQPRLLYGVLRTIFWQTQELLAVEEIHGNGLRRKGL